MKDTSIREASPPRRRVGPMIWLTLSVAACGRGASAELEPPSPANVAIIGAEGGSLTIADGPHAGVALHVPAGAVAAPTRFSIVVDVVHPQIPSLYPVYRFEPSTLGSTVPFAVTVRIGQSLFDTNDQTDATCFWQSPSGAWSALTDGMLDRERRTVSATTPRLGEFVAWNGHLHRLFTQDRMLLDPAAETPADLLAGVPVTIQNGRFALHVGRGSLEAFWRAPASENVLIVHGFLGSPLDFLGADDVAATLSPALRNVVLLAYPSASGAAVNANALYDEIVQQRQPGFGCSIVAHSMGGLVARYLIEQSATDRSRAGWRADDQTLAGCIHHLVMLGVPHAGTDIGTALVDVMLQFPPSERHLLQAAVDLSYRPDAVTMQLNATYVDNATHYHVIYGDIGDASDGTVTVASATAVPLSPPETATLFLVGHTELHGAAAANGITGLIDTILTSF